MRVGRGVAWAIQGLYAAALLGFHHVKADPGAFGCAGAIPVLAFLLLLPFQFWAFSIFFRLQHERRCRSDWVGMTAAILLVLAGALRLAL